MHFFVSSLPVEPLPTTTTSTSTSMSTTGGSLSSSPGTTATTTMTTTTTTTMAMTTTITAGSSSSSSKCGDECERAIFALLVVRSLDGSSTDQLDYLPASSQLIELFFLSFLLTLNRTRIPFELKQDLLMNSISKQRNTERESLIASMTHSPLSHKIRSVTGRLDIDVEELDVLNRGRETFSLQGTTSTRNAPLVVEPSSVV